MGFFSAVGSFFSGVVSAVSSAFSAVGKAFSVALNIVSAIVSEIAKAFGILKENDDPKDIGDRALQAEEAGILPEDFDSHEKYMEALRNFELDPEKSKKFSENEKKAAFIKVATLGLEELFDFSIPYTFWAEVARNDKYFTPERTKMILEKFSETGIDLEKISDYFETNLSPLERDKVEDTLVKTEKELNPDKNLNEIYDELDSMKR